MDMQKEIKEYLRTKKDNKNTFINRNVSVIGAKCCEGQSTEGVAKGYDELKKIGLFKVIESTLWKYIDVGSIETKHKLNNINNNHINNKEIKDDDDEYFHSIKNDICIGNFSKELFDKINIELKKKNFVLNIGGDHSIAFASILSALQIYEDLVVIWIDAHGDINIPETSPSQNYHGMPLAHVLNLMNKKIPGFEWTHSLKFLKPKNVIIIGLRDIDELEKIIIKKSGIHYFTMFDITKHGIYNIIEKALNIVDKENKKPIHISFDVDSIDPFYAPGTGTLARGGLTYREIHFLFKYLYDTNRVISMDLVEYNPDNDIQETVYHGDSLPISENAKKTGRLCLELVARILGNDIL